MEILDYKNIDINKISYEAPKKVKGGSFIAISSYDNENKQMPLIIQTPRLEYTNTKSSKSILELEFNKTHLDFYEFITGIDEFNISVIHEKSNLWFNKSFPEEIVEEFYRSIVKPGRSKNPPKLKIKLPISKGDINCSIYDSKNNIMSYSDINENSKILCVLKLIGLRFLKQQVICEWMPMQLKVFDCIDVHTISSGYFINDSLLSDDENESFNLLEENENKDNDNNEETNEYTDPQLEEVPLDINNLENIDSLDYKLELDSDEYKKIIEDTKNQLELYKKQNELKDIKIETLKQKFQDLIKNI